MGIPIKTRHALDLAEMRHGFLLKIDLWLEFPEVMLVD